MFALEEEERNFLVLTCGLAPVTSFQRTIRKEQKEKKSNFALELTDRQTLAQPGVQGQHQQRRSMVIVGARDMK